MEVIRPDVGSDKAFGNEKQFGSGSAQDGYADHYAPMYLQYGFGGLSMSVEELEEVALARLRVLKASSAARAALNAAVASNSVPTANAAANSEEINRAILMAEMKEGMNVGRKMSDERMERVLRDESSHFVLRLALCSSSEARQWLIAKECELFAVRLRSAGAHAAIRTLQNTRNAPRIEEVILDSSETELSAMLDAVSRGPRRGVGLGARHYKVGFEQVLNLVARRQVLVHKGDAYVPESFVQEILVSQFRSRLSQTLTTMSRSTAALDGHAAMGPLLRLVRAHYAAQEANNGRGIGSGGANGAVDVEDRLSLKDVHANVKSMPLCMQVLMNRLKESHHLRHQGRLQLGLFLKGAGFGMDESLRFWKTEFGKGSISSDQFDKGYSYNIRHYYGKEGKRKSLQPYSCMQVINKQPGPGELHGCPFRELREESLLALVRQSGVSIDQAKDIVRKARDGHYQVACGSMFTAKYPERAAQLEQQPFVTTHPNEYLIEARRHEISKEKGTVGNAPPVPFASQSQQEPTQNESTVPQFESPPVQQDNVDQEHSAMIDEDSNIANEPKEKLGEIKNGPSLSE